MEQERARALLRQERRRLQRLLAAVDADHDRVSTADEVAEDLVDGADRRTSEETDEALARQLAQRLQALRRAEGRLAAGTYGRSVLSGRRIPDERLEAFPLAELTVEEAAAERRGAVAERDGAVGLESPDHPFEVLDDADITPEEEQASEEDEDEEPAPEEPQGIRVEQDDRLL